MGTFMHSWQFALLDRWAYRRLMKVLPMHNLAPPHNYILAGACQHVVEWPACSAFYACRRIN